MQVRLSHEYNDSFPTFTVIYTGAEQNFDKYSDTLIGGFGENYDYSSVMHYSAYAFTGNGQKTIVTKVIQILLSEKGSAHRH